MIPYVYVSVYPLEKWFATYFECDSVANFKICLMFWGWPRFVWSHSKNPGKKHDIMTYILENPVPTIQGLYIAKFLFFQT